MSNVAPVVCAGVSPAIQRTLDFKRLEFGEVNRAASVSLSAAGKAVNVARGVKQLGCAQILAGFAGGPNGEKLRAMLDAEGIRHALTESRHETRVCQTLLDEKTGQVTELVEEMTVPEPEEWAAFLDGLQQALSRAALLTISGTLPPGAPDDLYARMIQMAHVSGVRTVLDSQKRPLMRGIAAKPFLVKLNRHELEQSVARSAADAQMTIDAARCLLQEGVTWALITHGAGELVLVGPDATHLLTPPKITPVNPIGSGDAVTAGIAAALVSGQSVPDAIRLGIACGTANALTRHPGFFEQADVNRFMAAL